MKSFPNGQRGEKDKFSITQDHEKKQRDTHFWRVGKTFPKVAECY